LVGSIARAGSIADDIPALMRGQYDICLLTYENAGDASPVLVARGVVIQSDGVLSKMAELSR
jgi:hypothetical protein